MEKTLEMFPFERLSVDSDTQAVTFTRTRPLITIEPPSETITFDQLPINADISSETIKINHSSVDYESPPKSSSRANSLSNSKAPSESFLRMNSLTNLEVPSESCLRTNSLTNLEVPPESTLRRRLSSNSELQMKTFSSDHPSINSEMASETIRNSHSSINLAVPPRSLTLQSSSINLEGLSNLFASKHSSVNFELEPEIALHRIPSIHSERPVESEERNRDAAFMQQMGYSQELKRGFSGLMSFTFCFTVVSVFPSISIGLDFGLATGGSGVLVWSWIVGSVFNILVGLSLSEICCTYPNSGSVYYWTGQLAPRRFAPLAAYTCGWCSYFGNVGGTAAFASGFASIINAAVALGTDKGQNTTGLNDVPHQLLLNNRIQTAIAIGVVIVWTLQNALKIDQQGWLNNLAAFIQTTSTIAIIATILALAKSRTSAHDVFIATNNSTGFSFAYVCCIGILPTLFSFSGFESAGHLSEETRDAHRKAPIAISGTCISAAFIGFVYLLALLFASGNPINLVQNQLNPSATVQIYETSTPFPVALLFTVLLAICLYFAGVSATTVSSRTGYAMARDSLFPCSKYLTIIFKYTQTPLASVLLVGVINIVLLALQFFSTTAFAAIVSISTIGFQISYLIPIIFRCTTARNTFKKGELNLGQFGVPIGIISSVWLLVTSVILLFPFNYPITAQNMNWTIVVCSGITIVAGLYWIFAVRQWFTGPPRMADAEITASQ